MPLSSPSPGLISLRENQTSLPSPGTPTRAVMMTIAMAIIIVWLMPNIMEFLARGNCTWKRVCRDRGPMGVGSLYGGARHLPDAEVREPDDGWNRIDDGEEHSLSTTHPEEDQGGNEIDEGGQDLHGVQDGSDD